MAKIKDTPKIDRPREKFLAKGPDALSKSDLLAILLGSGIKGKNAQQLAGQIIRKFGDNFLNTTFDDLRSITGIGEAKALQIVSAISLVKRFQPENTSADMQISNSSDAVSLVNEFRTKKKEHLVCLYLDARNILLNKEIISIGLANMTLIHPREIFYPAVEHNASGVILVHNHPSGQATPSEGDAKILNKILQAGKIMGIAVIDFIIISQKENYSFLEENTNNGSSANYIEDGQGARLFDLLEVTEPLYNFDIKKNFKKYYPIEKNKQGYFQIKSRRYLGNKYKLTGFIEDIIAEKCGNIKSFCDLFAGTGVVGGRMNTENIKIISNDILYSNFCCLQAFLNIDHNYEDSIQDKISYLNSLSGTEENYFSQHFGGTYFSRENSRKIGMIREQIDQIAFSPDERNILICSLIYAVDKVANTVGHYDAYRKNLDMFSPVTMLMPDIKYDFNSSNEVHRKDANQLINCLSCDVLYVDPPYNSRQYSDAYHLLENLAEWRKPSVAGIGKKMDRSHIKSDYCLKQAPRAFTDLISNAQCGHILVSYNNTGNSRDGRSNARISDDIILQVLSDKGNVEIFEKDYKAFSTFKNNAKNNVERIFYCEVK